jgi:hypothetical protein
VASHPHLISVISRCSSKRPGKTFYVPRNLREATHLTGSQKEEWNMDGLIYLVGLIVIIMFVLSLLGLR